MSLSNSLLSYQDCLEAMDQALGDPQGGRVRFPDQSTALHFRSRCHYARKLHRDKNAKIYAVEDPKHGCSEYDELILRERADDDGWWIYLERAAPGSIKVEPLSAAPQIERRVVAQLEQQHRPLLAAPAAVIEAIVKRRI